MAILICGVIHSTDSEYFRNHLKIHIFSILKIFFIITILIVCNYLKTLFINDIMITVTCFQCSLNASKRTSSGDGCGVLLFFFKKLNIIMCFFSAGFFPQNVFTKKNCQKSVPYFRSYFRIGFFRAFFKKNRHFSPNFYF